METAQQYVREGRRWVVDIDLEKFFDRVHHDRLMARVSTRVKDKRLLGLTRGFLTSGVLEGGLVSATEEGTPQGGPLSPLLSNIVLDELDQELEKRGHAFVRYADDCNIYVRSERAGQRVMESLRALIIPSSPFTLHPSLFTLHPSPFPLHPCKLPDHEDSDHSLRPSPLASNARG